MVYIDYVRVGERVSLIIKENHETDNKRTPGSPRRPGARPADWLREDGEQPQAEDVEREDAGVLLHRVVCGSRVAAMARRKG